MTDTKKKSQVYDSESVSDGERPILFNSKMVRAILDGRKTQTRRVIKLNDPTKDCMWCYETGFEYVDCGNEKSGHDYRMPCRCQMPKHSYGRGDRLWVREAWSPDHSESDIRYLANNEIRRFLYQEEWFARDWRRNKNTRPKRPSIHMWRWMSRINLEITAVRVERVQDISEDDCDAEIFGGEQPHVPWCDGNYPGEPDVSKQPVECMGRCGSFSLQEIFKEYWNEIKAKRGFGWEANPWVWVIEFRRIQE